MANAERRHQGRAEPLSKTGKEQALSVAKRLINIPIDLIYASPYIRTKETAEIISKKLKLPIEYWGDIEERKRPSEIHGLKTDHPKAVKINSLTEEKWLAGNWKYSDEESYNELTARAQKVLDHLVEKHSDQDVLCVSHGGIIKTIVARAVFSDKLTPEVFWEFYNHSWLSNTGIVHMEYIDKYGWGLGTWNDTTHL